MKLTSYTDDQLRYIGYSLHEINAIRACTEVLTGDWSTLIKELHKRKNRLNKVIEKVEAVLKLHKSDFERAQTDVFRSYIQSVIDRIRSGEVDCSGADISPEDLILFLEGVEIHEELPDFLQSDVLKSIKECKELPCQSDIPENIREPYDVALDFKLELSSQIEEARTLTRRLVSRIDGYKFNLETQRMSTRCKSMSNAGATSGRIKDGKWN